MKVDRNAVKFHEGLEKRKNTKFKYMNFVACGGRWRPTAVEVRPAVDADRSIIGQSAGGAETRCKQREAEPAPERVGTGRSRAKAVRLPGRTRESKAHNWLAGARRRRETAGCPNRVEALNMLQDPAGARHGCETGQIMSF